MARVESRGGFALTEPEHGSDSVALESSARRDRHARVIQRDRGLPDPAVS
jgi:glutaryl-CoA dehydrogenase